jgi:isopenicillin-N epimerase
VKFSKATGKDPFPEGPVVRLPLVGEATDERALALRSTLRKGHRIDAAVIAFKGSLWVRLSAQAYNQFNEYERLADAFRG